MKRNFELKTEYKLQPEVDISTDISKGLRRSMPIAYDAMGRYKKPPIVVPYWAGVMFVALAWVIGWAWL